MVNELNELVLTYLASCCAPALGVYRVGHVRLSPDRLNSHLSFCTNSSEAVKLFKRANKNVAQTILQSQDPNLTPEDDRVAYFTSVFSQPDARLQGLPAHLAAVIGSPCSKLFSYFSAANVKTHIIHYPKSVSCGADSMHAWILEALLPSGIDTVLSLLFQICVITGSTPAL
ncbi:hypothetical protein DSO57_1029381 [Entomophthora muscae]|uniref:Uncharacterized protein n=1 Tax=Entomophthora muscae TaxID=34485 RepID=A0ACC2TMZ8_9FUNG|nr:hypothetical protein DSO57_1029381 [Entomophthora muscae]